MYLSVKRFAFKRLTLQQKESTEKNPKKAPSTVKLSNYT